MKRLEEEDLWSKILVFSPNECWIWGGMVKNGYGRTRKDGKDIRAHRAAFEFHWGIAIPSWLHVCHDCPGGDNKLCCNPDHLFLADAVGHVADKIAKGQFLRGDRHPLRANPQRAARGEHVGTSKLTNAKVRLIRKRIQDGVPQRVIAREFGVCQRTIGDIHRFEKWKHVVLEGEE